MKIRTRLLVLMFGLVSITLALSNLLNYFVNASEAKKDIVMMQALQTLETVSKIDAFFDVHAQRVRDQTEHLHALIHLYEGDIRLSLERFVHSDLLYREEALVQSNGVEIARVLRGTSFPENEKRNFSNDPLFLRVLEDKQCQQKESRSQAFNETEMTLYCPVFDEDKSVSHVLVHIMTLKPLGEILSSVKVGEAGYALVADAQGDVIAHSGFSKGLNRSEVIDLPLYKRLVQAKNTLDVQEKVWTEESDDFAFSGAVSQRSGWGVMAVQSLNEADWPSDYLAGRSMAGMGVLLVLAAVFSMIFSKRFTAPLRALTYAVESFGDGDLEFMVQVQTNDEIGELSKGLNAMAERLKKTTVSRDNMDNIVSSMLNSVIVVTTEGSIKTVNKATCALLAYREEELIGQRISRIIGNEIFLNFDQGEMDQADHILKKECTYLTKMGKEIPVLFSGSVMREKDGEVQGLVCVAQDISELKAAEVELKSYAERLGQSNKELDDFAHVASHDLQEPLRKVIAFGDRLKQKCGEALSAQGRDYLGRMQNAALRMQQLIDGLLSFARVSSKAQPFEEVDLQKVIADVISDLEIRIEQTKGKVAVAEMPTIDADPLQMRQLFQNLIGNALKFSRPGEPPQVNVSSELYTEKQEVASIDGGRKLCVITVKDQGIGFDDRYVERIFGVFQRLHGKNEYEGTGVGLSVCKKIVERHSGTIWAMGMPGKGASFIVTLPIKQNRGDASNG